MPLTRPLAVRARLSSEVIGKPRDTLKLAVPAVLYLAMNMLGFVSLARVDAGTFAIVQQSKIFFTAVFAMALLGKQISKNQASSCVSTRAA